MKQVHVFLRKNESTKKLAQKSSLWKTKIPKGTGIKSKREIHNEQLCFNPTCSHKGLQCYIDRCDIFEEATKKELLGENRDAKKGPLMSKKRTDNKIEGISGLLFAPYFASFKASFTTGRWKQLFLLTKVRTLTCLQGV